MKAMVCELCGSNQFVKQDGMFICQHCNTKYSPEDAKKLMVEVKGKVDVSGSTVKVDSTDSLENSRQLARRAKEAGNSENAEKYYSLVAMQDPNDWEANFYTVYYSSMQTNIAGIANAAIRVANSLSSVLNLIKKADVAVQNSAVKEVRSKCGDFADMLEKSAVSHYNGIDESIRDKYKGELKQRREACRDMLYLLGDLIEANFGGNPVCCVQAALAWKQGTQIHGRILGKGAAESEFTFDEKLYKYERKIGKYDSSYYAEKSPVWIKKKEYQLKSAESRLNNLEKSKNAFNPAKLPWAIGGTAAFIVCFIIFMTSNPYYQFVLFLVSIFIGLIALFVAVVNWFSTFPSKKKREKIESAIEQNKNKINILNKEYTDLLEETQK